jgi:deazaflavin-dependent oxidoreductase (nitroreductase family)
MAAAMLTGFLASGPGAAVAATDLAAVADRSTLRITTRGRKSGQPHTVTVWFVVDGPTIYLTTLDATRDWVRNLEKTPEVEIEVGTLRLQGRGSTVTDAALDAQIRAQLVDKYWLAWVGSWFGKGPERTFRIDDLRAAGT